MLKEVTVTLEVCDVCQQEEKVCECDFCKTALCRTCYQRVYIRFNDEPRNQRILCEKCKNEVYGAYLKKLEEVNDVKSVFLQKVEEANQLLTDINKKTL